MIKPGNSKTDAMVNTFLGLNQRSQKNKFIMEWHGSKIPRGAVIDNTEIGWTQHGIISGVDRSNLGFYNRLVEFGDNNLQRIEIFTDSDDVVDPNGKTLTPEKR